ncbi:selenocysteine-specific translation elongation factor [Gracilibacillus sp. YIM 98692]|uniref:selenocysteine-specific translation elongation factor n=1 Tax=Gracilibacillus sp. YIM 98692 TaxID=2663532 RepID=UPI0013D7983E|nr:selenocysteine-specific translation elongation factor [Gracilibacillus sp. YIM 98692]
MEDKYYTIGMAGHIDHGKTSLTKALTNIDTDRLKEEKERSISIELGYAPLYTKDGSHVSIVDVPGHERFIRQMIAGVAGIDLVIIVIAADEGVMPQTKEHLEILEFLGIKHAIIAVTKIDQVDQEMLDFVRLDINETLESTIFNDVTMHYVDSVSGKGIEDLKESVFEYLQRIENRDQYGSFRMPIDQVFTVQGQGTIARGTVYEGMVKKASPLMILPSEKKVRARNIQVHNQDEESAQAGQRTAINLSGVDRDEVQRGDVLVASDHFLVTNTIDVSIQFVHHLMFAVKQRMPVKIHVGTSEVMGKIVFFDRNVVQEKAGEVLCQLRLDKEIVVCRGDRFILRRPTPVETIGGGWIIDPKGEKYRFGNETVSMLQKKKEGTPADLVKDALSANVLLSLDEIVQVTSLDMQEVKEIVDGDDFVSLKNGQFSLKKLEEDAMNMVMEQMENYHQSFPMRLGINKVELTQSVKANYPNAFIDHTIDILMKNGQLEKVNPYISKTNFQPHLPEKWKKRMEEVITNLEKDGLSVRNWEEYVNNSPFTKREASELKAFLLQTNQAYRLTEDLMIHKRSFDHAVKKLREQTGDSFNLKQAKDVWNVSRKFLIPLLELLDYLKITKRVDNERHWL